jgi:hypothetical protein
VSKGAAAKVRPIPVPVERVIALRTAFVARFVVLREGRRTRAHRVIEEMSWSERSSAEELAARFREAFVENGDKMQPVDRDIRRALEHAQRSVDYFLSHYVARATLNFKDALSDYARSNELLFGGEDEEPTVPRSGGWRVPVRATQ